MRSIIILALFGILLLLPGVTFAETSAECQARCASESASRAASCPRPSFGTDQERSQCLQAGQDAFNGCITSCQQAAPSDLPADTSVDTHKDAPKMRLQIHPKMHPKRRLQIIPQKTSTHLLMRMQHYFPGSEAVAHNGNCTLWQAPCRYALRSAHKPGILISWRANGHGNFTRATHISGGHYEGGRVQCVRR